MVQIDQRSQTDTCEVECVHPETVDAVRGALLEDASAQLLSETFEALSDRTRLKIIHALSLSELCVCDISAILGISQSATSHQLRLLRNLRLVRNRREGRMVFYALDDSHILNLFAQGLEHVAEEANGPRIRDVKDK